jgi:hypothetical protein
MVAAAAEDTHALSYRDRSGAFFYIPTCPRPANKWRGPYPTEAMMRRAMRDELGDEVVEKRTTVNGADRRGHP